MNDLTRSSVHELFTELDAIIGKFDYCVSVRFRGRHRDLVTMSLAVDAEAFGARGGAELTERQRGNKAMASDAAYVCPLPFAATSVNNRFALYSLIPDDAEEYLHQVVGRVLRGMENYKDFAYLMIEETGCGRLPVVFRATGGEFTGVSLRFDRCHGSVRRGKILDAEW